MAKAPANQQGKDDGDFNRLDGFLLNAMKDPPDFRDYRYQPTLMRLQPTLLPPNQPMVLDQGEEGACTGFGLAAVINVLLAGEGSPRKVSPRMLYEMAKKHDEWEGEGYAGSSCRGAVKGWHSMGACAVELAPYRVNEPGWALNIDQAKDARKTTVGAYYRVSKRVSDYHAALNEVGALYVSALVHEGWKKENIVDGVIPLRSETVGSHAFAVVGYDERGFWVQNSWGESWGQNGLALWQYEDWLVNGQDAWVVRLAISTPQIWHLTPTGSEEPAGDLGIFRPRPKRAEIVGHFVHIDDGDFDDRGRYWMDLETVRQTAEFLAQSDKYDHLLFYAHGGLNSIDASARRIVAMKEVFKENRIYPFHFMYDTGLMEEIKDVVLGKKDGVESRAGGFTDVVNKLIEDAVRPGGRAIWREIKQGANRPFEAGRAGAQTIAAFLDAFAAPGAKPKHIHLAGHSTGAILVASLLEALGKFPNAPRIQTCALMAPACTHDDFNNVYRPLLHERRSDSFGIRRMTIYNLNEELERADTVTPIYRRSLLYLVSNACEEKRGERILGMQIFRSFLGQLPGERICRIETSDGTTTGSPKTASKSHGGFDNDVATMNDILGNVLRDTPSRFFKESDLAY